MCDCYKQNVDSATNKKLNYETIENELNNKLEELKKLKKEIKNKFEEVKRIENEIREKLEVLKDSETEKKLEELNQSENKINNKLEELNQSENKTNNKSEEEKKLNLNEILKELKKIEELIRNKSSELEPLKENVEKNDDEEKNIQRIAIPFEKWYLELPQKVTIKVKAKDGKIGYISTIIKCTQNMKNGQKYKLPGSDIVVRISFVHHMYRREGLDLICYLQRNNVRVGIRDSVRLPDGRSYGFDSNLISNRGSKIEEENLGFTEGEKRGKLIIRVVEKGDDTPKQEDETYESKEQNKQNKEQYMKIKKELERLEEKTQHLKEIVKDLHGNK